MACARSIGPDLSTHSFTHPWWRPIPACLNFTYSCPLIAESSRPGDFTFPSHVASNCDVRRDIPGYRIYEDGRFVREAKSIEEEWEQDSVAFLIGCSQSFESVLMSNGLTPRHIQKDKTVSMYKTNIPLCPAGGGCVIVLSIHGTASGDHLETLLTLVPARFPSCPSTYLASLSRSPHLDRHTQTTRPVFSGHFVVSMRPYRPEQVEAVRAFTRPFVDTHGEPVAWGFEGQAKLGIPELDKPDFGDAPDLQPGEIPVFWGCGVTPQLAVMDSKISGRVISHKPGSMLVLDLMDADVCVDL